MDKLYFHEIFSGLHIKKNERATSFLKLLTYRKTTAEAAFNTYTEEQLVDYVLAGLCHTRKDVYRTAIQFYQSVKERSLPTMKSNKIYLKLMRN
jgi:hypothetical protein